MRRGVRKGLKVVIIPVIPADTEFLGDSPAAFRESCVTNPAIEGQHLSPGGVHGFSDSLTYGTRKSLITLTMVIRTDIKILVVGVVVPSYISSSPALRSAGQHPVKFRYQLRQVAGEGFAAFPPAPGPGENLRHNPRTGNDGVGLEKFKGRGGFHLRRNDAHKVILHAHHIDCCQSVLPGHNLQSTGKTLTFLLLPVETFSDDHIVKHERSLGKHCRKGVLPEIELIVESPVILDFPLLKHSLP